MLLDSLHCGGDVQASEARRGELAGVDVGDLGHGGVDALRVLSLHHQDGLGGVEVELHPTHSGWKVLVRPSLFVSQVLCDLCACGVKDSESHPPPPPHPP